MAVFDLFNGYITDIRGSKYLTLGDVERCPYVPRDPEYAHWNEKDIQRCQQIIDARKSLHNKAFQYMSHTDPNVRLMALFIVSHWGDLE